MMTHRFGALIALLVLSSISFAGCGDSSTDSATATTGSSDPFAACERGVLESDLATNPPLSGPGVDPKTHALAPGKYVLATTYLALVPAEAKRASELGGDVVASLPTMKGLVAFSLASSASCATLRTLTVWESEEDMTAFVASPAHAKAMAEIHTLSRGTSDVTSWSGDEKDASFQAGAAALAKVSGSGL